MTLGLADRQTSLLDPVVSFCDEQVDGGSVFALLHRERDRLFPDEMFADLYEDVGRRSKPPSVLATLLVLQRLLGLSDRETVDRFTFDARFRYACGVGDWSSGPVSMTHTVLVRFRMRLAGSDDPKRIFRVTTDVAGEAGLLGVKRVLDSAPLFDAVATMDTVTLIRSAVRRLLKVADDRLEADVRAVLSRDDDYRSAGKPACDWDDADARAELVDGLAADGLGALQVTEDRVLDGQVAEAVQLLAAVVGQDIEQADDGTFRIVRGVATDRIVSTVDPDARHGRKSTSGKFDGFKGHIAVDPDSEIVTATAVGPANGPDADMTARLTGDLDEPDDSSTDEDHDGDGGSGSAATDTDHGDGGGEGSPAVYGDAAYGSGDNLDRLHQRGIDANVKVQPPSNRAGRFTKDDFDLDLDADTATCPAGNTVDITRRDDGSGVARFGTLCETCPLRAGCTDAKAGRTVSISRHEPLLAAARQRQTDGGWRDDYRATRPKVERKLAHGLRAGRRAARRGTDNIDLDWSLRFAGVNLARLARQGLQRIAGTWKTAPAPA